MASVGERDNARRRIEHARHHGHELRRRRLRGQRGVDVAQQIGRRRIGAGEDGEGRGHARHHQRGGNPLAADVGDDEVDPAVGADHDVVIIATHCLAGAVRAGETVAFDLRQHIRQQPALNGVGRAQLFIDLRFRESLFAQTRALESDGGEARDLRKQAHIVFGNNAAPRGVIDVENAEDRVGDQERRTDGGTDPLGDDRLRAGELVVLFGIEVGNDLAPVDHFAQQRSTDGQVGRFGVVLRAQLHVGERNPIITEEGDGRPRRAEKKDDPVEDEVEQLRHRPVGQKLQR